MVAYTFSFLRQCNDADLISDRLSMPFPFQPQNFHPQFFWTTQNLPMVSEQNIILRKGIKRGSGRGSSTQSLWVSALLTLLHQSRCTTRI